MHAVLQKDGLFGDDGPQTGTRFYVSEIRKVEGEYTAYCVKVVAQDVYESFWVPLDDLMVAHTENTETYWSTMQ